MSDASAMLTARISAVLARVVPDFRRLIAAERLSGGASQETYKLRIDSTRGEIQLALRRAAGGAPLSRDEGQVGLVTEAQLLQAAAKAEVPVPHVLAVLTVNDGLGDGFVMSWLEGETLGVRLVRAASLADIRPQLAFQCGQILARIHAIDVITSGLAERLEVVTPSALIQRTWQRYQGFATPQPMIDYTARWLLANLPPPCPPRLVHGDFRNGNLMVTPRGIVAVLDWEIAHRGDPLRDLGWLCTNSWRFGVTEKPVGGFGEVVDLIAGYTAESGPPIAPAAIHFWQVFGSFWWAVGCLSMAAHFRVGPDQTVERPAIGRRSSECQIDCVNLLIPGATETVSQAPQPRADDLPRIDELLISVRDFLRNDVMAATQDRTQFLARVAANSLDIVAREVALGPLLAQREQARLENLLGRRESLANLRWQLVQGLRDGQLALDSPALIEHLRATVVNQALLDQPSYSGCKTALSHCTR